MRIITVTNCGLRCVVICMSEESSDAGCEDSDLLKTFLQFRETEDKDFDKEDLDLSRRGQNFTISSNSILEGKTSDLPLTVDLNEPEKNPNLLEMEEKSVESKSSQDQKGLRSKLKQLRKRSKSLLQRIFKKFRKDEIITRENLEKEEFDFEKHFSKLAKLEEKKQAIAEKIKNFSTKRLKTFQEQVEERKALERLKKRSRPVRKPSKNRIIRFSITVFERTTGVVKKTVKFLYTKVHIFVYLSPSVFFFGRAIKRNHLRWFEYAKHKIEFASEWVAIEDVILDEYVFSHHIFIKGPVRLFIAPFALFKYLLWDSRIFEEEYSSYLKAEVTIGVRPLQVIIYLIIIIYLNWKWNYFGEWEYAMAEDKLYGHKRRTPFHPEFGLQNRGVGVGFLGERPSWSHLRSLKDFIRFIRSWW